VIRTLIRKKKNKQGQFWHLIGLLGAPTIMMGAPSNTPKSGGLDTKWFGSFFST